MGVNRGSLLHPTVTGKKTSLLISKGQAARKVLTHRNRTGTSLVCLVGFFFQSGAFVLELWVKRGQVELTTLFDNQVNLTRRNGKVYNDLNPPNPNASLP